MIGSQAQYGSWATTPPALEANGIASGPGRWPQPVALRLIAAIRSCRRAVRPARCSAEACFPTFGNSPFAGVTLGAAGACQAQGKRTDNERARVFGLDGGRTRRFGAQCRPAANRPRHYRRAGAPHCAQTKAIRRVDFHVAKVRLQRACLGLLGRGGRTAGGGAVACRSGPSRQRLRFLARSPHCGRQQGCVGPAINRGAKRA